MLKAKNTIVCPACGREWGLDEDLKEGDACPSDDCPSNQKTVQPTVDETIQRMKDEILVDVKKGIVPKDVKSFGELHDYVDANKYGGFCEDGMADKLIEQFGGRTADEGMPDGKMKYLNDAQDAVSQWIIVGGINYALIEYIDLRVLVKPRDHIDVSPVDVGVEGVYTVSVPKELPRRKMASVVLDVFHSEIAIDVLDDYNFHVFDPVTGQVIYEDDDHESYSGKEMGKDCEQLSVVVPSLYKFSIDGEGVVIVADNGKEAQAKWLNILYGLWDQLSDVPVVFDGNNVATINEPFLHFPVGTNREEIWRWFEKNPAFIVGDVMQGIRKQLTV